MKRVIALAATAALAFASIASAQSGPRAAVRQSCAADIQQLCGGLKGRPLRKCVRVHQADLSTQCKAALAAAHLKAKEIKP